MKRFTHYITETEQTDAQSILGRNIAAKTRYAQLLKSNPEAAQAFLDKYRERREAHETLYTLLKSLVGKHLSHTSKLNITSKSNYAIAMSAVAQEVRKQFPQLTQKQIAQEMNRIGSDTDTAASKLIDILYPNLKNI